MVWYDNVTIRHSGIVSAALGVDPFDFVPNGDAYDLYLVFAGASNGEHTNFESMNVSLGTQTVFAN